MNNQDSQGISDYQDFDLKYWLLRILKYWYFFLIVGVVFLAVARVYLRYTVKTYSVQASLLIGDDSESRDLGDGLFSGRLSRTGISQNVETQIAILTSHDIIRKTLDSLNFQVSYFKEGQIKVSEIYLDSPIEVKLEPGFEQTSEKLFFDFDGHKKYNVVIEDAEETKRTFECTFGKLCQNDEFSFVTYIKDSANISQYEEPLFIKINDLDRLTVLYRNKISAGSRNDQMTFIPGNIVDLSIGGSLIEKNTVFLNTLSQVFIQHTFEGKSEKVNSTIRFVNEQIRSITDSLTWVERALENYRTNEKIIDISSKGELVLSRLTDLENQKSLIELNQKYYSYLSDYLKDANSSSDQVVSPASVGITDPGLAGLILELNQLISSKAIAEVTSGEKNFALQGIRKQINSVKGRLHENVKNILANNQISLNEIDKRLETLRSEINQLPRNERELLTIQRKFNVNNELYTFLLRRKAESEINLAGTTANIRVLNKARGIEARFIGPKSMRIYIVAALSSLLLVLGVIIVRFMINNTITDVNQLTGLGSVSILGQIPNLGRSQRGRMVKDSPRGRLAEAFRNLRINLDFVIPNSVGRRGKVIGITSEASGEGKTFCAINLSQILAMADKKTLLIGLDLRKPRIQEEIGLKKDLGLSNYLIGAATLDEIIEKSGVGGLDVISSGPVPPNPTELIENGKLKELLEAVTQDYDYIVIDGPPIGLVTDYIAAVSLFQTTLFVLRLDYSKTNSYRILKEYIDKGMLKSSHVIINSVRDSGHYGYGYYHEESTKGMSFLKKILLRKRS